MPITKYRIQTKPERWLPDGVCGFTNVQGNVIFIGKDEIALLENDTQ
jgi:hypothetical protein